METYFLPYEELKRYNNKCNEKIESYQLIAKIGLPVLKSVVLSNKEVEKLGAKKEYEIIKFLENSNCMIRYLYHNVHNRIKNGGRIVSISQKSLLREREEGADFWLLEPFKREDNILCCNVCLSREMQNLHMEFLGEGFDVSDINKGKIQPHEQIDIPYPIPYGEYKEWWKWAHFYFCTHSAYQESITIRKNRLKEFGSNCDVIFPSSYRAADKDIIECLLAWIEKIEESWIGKKPNFYNLSCSFQKKRAKDMLGYTNSKRKSVCIFIISHL